LAKAQQIEVEALERAIGAGDLHLLHAALEGEERGAPCMRTSSWGCMILDAVIAVWFLAGAPAIFGARRRPATTVDVAASRAIIN
jgi:predicted small integral membrane protein